MLIKLYEKNNDYQSLNLINKALKSGELIIYPTDTSYAIGCDIYQARAVEKICKIKGVNPKKANLSFICEELSQVSEYAKMENKIFKIIRKNLPGPFTFILNGNNILPKLFKQRKEVGIRIPSNNIIKQIVHELGNPIMTTTLKPIDDQTEYTTNPELIEERYGHEVALVIDGGIGFNYESTIVDCTSGNTEIIRQGIGELIE